MHKLAKAVLLIFVFSTSFVFASRIDQGSTADGSAFASGGGQCQNSSNDPSDPGGTGGAPCLRWFPNGGSSGLIGAINAADSSGSFSPVTDIYQFGSAATVTFTPSSPFADYGVANCGLTTSGNSNINIFSAGGGAHVPCVDLTANASGVDPDFVVTQDISGNDVFTYTGNTLQSIVFYVKYDSGTAGGTFSATQSATAPEPASAMLFVTGLGSLLTFRRRRA